LRLEIVWSGGRALRRRWFGVPGSGGRRTKSVERTATPLLGSTPGGDSGVPRALHRSCRRRSLTSGVGTLDSLQNARPHAYILRDSNLLGISAGSTRAAHSSRARSPSFPGGDLRTTTALEVSRATFPLHGPSSFSGQIVSRRLSWFQQIGRPNRDR